MLLLETIKNHDKEKFQFIVGYFLPWKDQLVSAIEKLQSEVICYDKSNNWQILSSGNQVSKSVIDNNIDIIHAHLPWAGILARRVLKRTGVPVIYTEHNKQERYHPLTRWMNKWSFNNQDMAIAVSKDVEESIYKNIHPSIPVRTILNGVNIKKFDPEKHNKCEEREKLYIPEDAIVIGTVAVFRKQKRLDIWMELAGRIKKKYPETFFIILGDGPEEVLVRQRIQVSNIKNSVILPGRLDEVRPWLAAMDLFLMTSEFEGLPLALLEAMTMELPVVATDAGGIKEVVRDGVEGFLKPVDKPMELEEPLSRLVEDEELRIKMGKRGRERVIEAFGLERMVRELEETYFEVLAKRQ